MLNKIIALILTAIMKKILDVIIVSTVMVGSSALAQTTTPYDNVLIEWNPYDPGSYTGSGADGDRQVLGISGGVDGLAPTTPYGECITGDWRGSQNQNSHQLWQQSGETTTEHEICMASWSTSAVDNYDTTTFGWGEDSSSLTFSMDIAANTDYNLDGFYIEMAIPPVSFGGNGPQNWSFYGWEDGSIMNGGVPLTEWIHGSNSSGVTASVIGQTTAGDPFYGVHIDFAVLGLDGPQYAAQDTNITFALHGYGAVENPNGSSGSVYMGDTQILGVAHVPEPNTALLGLLTAGLFGLRRRR